MNESVRKHDVPQIIYIRGTNVRNLSLYNV